jgi:hypothetical protein
VPTISVKGLEVGRISEPALIHRIRIGIKRIEVPFAEIHRIVDSLSLVIVSRCWQEAILITGEAGSIVIVLATSDHKAERDYEAAIGSTHNDFSILNRFLISNPDIA